ncbi:MAG: 4Fe-4S binding protein [Chloroflexi bacterium]|nr:4Fe-4S binding protein [Chloroflexota bacterium]
MSRLHSLVYLLPELWRTLFTRPITVRYPFGPLELPPYFRGKVIIEPTLCTGCGACVRDCPAFALELERKSDALNKAEGLVLSKAEGSKGHEEFRLIHYHDRCAYCGQCQDVCRQGAIRLTSEYVPAAADRDALREEFGKGAGA